MKTSKALMLHVERLTIERGEDGEFRIRDIDLATNAGMAQPRNVRQLIQENRAELEENGLLHERTRRVRSSMPRGGEAEREVAEYWLSEAQAYNLVALMRTPMAAKLRPLMSRALVEARRQAERQSVMSQTVAGLDRVMRALLAPKPQEWEQCIQDSLVRQLAELDGYTWNGGRHPWYLRSTYRKMWDTVFSTDFGRILKARCPAPRKGDSFHQQTTPEAREYWRNELRVVEAIARQSDDKADFWDRMERQYGGGMLQLSMAAE